MAYGPITVTSSATIIIAANAKRKKLHLVNTSEVRPVYIGPDASITTTNSIPLYETQTRDDVKTFGYWLGDIYGITTTGTADVRYWEVT